MQVFQTAEQYMMYRKATLFSDTEIAAKILQTPKPRKQKELGRGGNYWKFTNPENKKSTIKEELLETGERELVEASPFDRIWGVGFKAEEAGGRREMWGENLLGKALGRVRARVRAEGGK
ncbi:MAG: hypothetical protein Q9195_007921 [Heterodermia aff. obscurata]